MQVEPQRELEPMMDLQIAIDGPVAAGKGDIAAMLAQKLGLVNINTGGFYRALAYACRQENVSTKDTAGVLGVLQKTIINQTEPPKGSERSFAFTVNGKDVTEEIFRENMGSSDVAVIPEVRQQLVKLQREIAKGKKVVMEGRDIGLRVLPDAQLKIYLDASVEERARRRWEQEKTKGINRTLEEVLTETIERDKQDTGRLTDPLQKLPDAWELDTTGMTQDQVVEVIIAELRRRKLL